MPSINLNHEYPEINQADANALAIGALNGVLKSDGANGFSVVPVDAAPTANSTNLVESGGVKAAIDAAVQTAVPKRTASNDPSSSSFSVLCDTAIAGQAKPKLYGKSVVINQKLGSSWETTTPWSASNATISAADGIVSFTASAQNGGMAGSAGTFFKAGHKIAILCMVKQSEATADIVRLSSWSSGVGENSVGSIASTAWQQLILLKSITTSNSGNISVIDRRTGSWDAVQTTNFMFIDLTDTFGSDVSSITDAATLKTAWLKKFGYPLPQSIPYNQGSIVSNNATYQMHGRNLFNAATAQDDMLGNRLTGEVVSNAGYACSAAIKVAPSTAYYASGVLGNATYAAILEYDANGAFIASQEIAGSTPASRSITTAANTAYIRLNMMKTAKSTVMFSLGSTATPYEAYYNGGSVTADNLNGIGTAVDSQDAEGQIVRKINAIALTDFEWSVGDALFEYALTQGAVGYDGNNLCSCYQKSAINNINAISDLSYIVRASRIYIKDSRYNTTEAFVAANAGQSIAYELATATTSTTTAASIQTQAGYNSLEPVAGDVQSADASVEYPVDVIAYIDKKLAEL